MRISVVVGFLKSVVDFSFFFFFLVINSFFFFLIILTWKIVGVSETSIYIYIYIY